MYVVRMYVLFLFSFLINSVCNVYTHCRHCCLSPQPKSNLSISICTWFAGLCVCVCVWCVCVCSHECACICVCVFLCAVCVCVCDACVCVATRARVYVFGCVTACFVCRVVEANPLKLR